MKFKILDLFCGAGGFSNGFEQNKNFKTIIGVDCNKFALETFKYNHPNSKIIHGDLKDVFVKKYIINEAQKNGINMIIGGPPCQGFSSKGKNLGLQDERNFLFKEYLEIVKIINPDIFIIENVKNLITCEKSYFLNEIKKEIKQLNYKLEYKVLNALDFGIPQNRQRAFLIASKNFKFDFSKIKKKNKISVRDAISDLAYLNSNEGFDESEYLFEAQSAYQKLLRGKKLFNHKATNHSKVAIDKLKLIPSEGGKEFLPKKLHGKQKFKTTWSRLKWDEVSPTIDTRFDTPSNGKNSHPFLHRSITPREAARIQSFGDNFKFLGTKTEICKQIGNAVPPLLAKAIAEAIMEQI